MRNWILAGAIALAPAAALPGTAAKAQCRNGNTDKPETGLQGQTTAAERTSGASALGFNCNTDLVGQFEGEGASYGFAWFEDCAYYGTANLSQQKNKGVVVLDVTNPSSPKATQYLTTPAMLEPWESLKVHETKKYLGGVGFNGPSFDLYDISGDCRHPTLLSSTVLPLSIGGHAGNFSGDGNTYYGSQLTPTGRIYPIDLSDPRNPKALTTWALPNNQALHDLSVSPDGNRMYLTQIGSGTGLPNGLLIVDVSDIQKRVASPQFRVVGSLFWPDGATAQQAIQVTIGGKPHIIFTDEHGSAGSSAKTNASKSVACGLGLPPSGFVRIIDVSDETNPKTVSKITMEIDDPANCASILANTPDVISSSSHYCNVDTTTNPTMLACSYREAGLRIFDIQDLQHPREIGYFKPRARRTEVRAGSVFWGPQYTAGADRTTDQTASNVRVVGSGMGAELWFTSHDNAFQVVRLDNGGGGCTSVSASDALALLGLLPLLRRRKKR